MLAHVYQTITGSVRRGISRTHPPYDERERWRVQSGQRQNREGAETTKGVVRFGDTFSVARSREPKHECQPPFVETEFSTSRCGGAKGIRTPDLFHAMEARYQLRHSPKVVAISRSDLLRIADEVA